MELNNKKVVMTGATGFIGRHVARRLLEEGAIVYALVRKSSHNIDMLPSHDNIHILYGDMSDIDNATKDIDKADLFLHFGWGGVNRDEIDSDIVQQKNIDDSTRCLEAAARMSCEVFMDAGSRVEYGKTLDGCMKEDMTCSPINAYGRAKLSFFMKSRELADQYSMKYYHLRFFSVYGTDDHAWSIISTLTTRLPQGKKVSLSACMHRWNFMYIDDAASAVVELYRYSDRFDRSYHIVNVASDDTRVLRQYVEEIYELCDKKGELEYGSFLQAKEGALDICPSIEELKRLTCDTWSEKYTFDKGIKEILKRR